MKKAIPNFIYRKVYSKNISKNEELRAYVTKTLFKYEHLNSNGQVIKTYKVKRKDVESVDTIPTNLGFIQNFFG